MNGENASSATETGIEKAVVAVPRIPHRRFHCLWASGTGWGTFTYEPSVSGGRRFSLRVLNGNLGFRSCVITSPGAAAVVQSGNETISHTLEVNGERMVVRFQRLVVLHQGDSLVVEAEA